jgi:apolipoprotein N-acyltransferase
VLLAPRHLNKLPSWKKFLLAGLSGLFGVVVFPKVGGYWLVWICLVPLLISSYHECKKRRAFLWGFTTGLVFFVGICGWITSVLRNFGDLSWVGAAASFLLLAAYLSLFYGCFSVVFAEVSLHFPTGSFYLSPFLWVGTEYLRTHLLTGFPWCLLGYALVDCLNLAQLSTVTGVYGVSFVILLINSLVAQVLLVQTRSALWQLGVTSVVLVGLSISFSVPASLGGKQQVRIVQTDIAVEQDWSPEGRSRLLEELSRLSGQTHDSRDSTSGQQTQITLWPETPAPFYFNQDPVFRHRMLELAKTSNRYLLFGFVDLRKSEGDTRRRDPYNSVALVSPDGGFVSQYDKTHLVPFGEYVPYANIFFFVDKISTEAGNFKAGSEIVVSPIGPNHHLGTFVCYESILPDLVRRFAAQGAEVLVNVTNDGWFGDSPAPYQHLNMARFRAIENHRYLLRAANSGISAVIDPYGRVQTKTSLNQRTSFDSTFEWETSQTFYTRHGDVFVWICVSTSGLTIGLIVKDRWRGRVP